MHLMRPATARSKYQIKKDPKPKIGVIPPKNKPKLFCKAYQVSPTGSIRNIKLNNLINLIVLGLSALNINLLF